MAEAGSDREILARVAKGDADAWEEFLVRYKNLAYALILRITRLREDADDAFQNTFLRVRAYAKTFTFGDDARKWLTQIACREALKMVEKRAQAAGSHVSLDSELLADEQGEDASERMEVGEIMKKAVDALPDGLRSVVVLHFAAGMTQAEVAKELNCTQALVSIRLKEALGLLRQKLTAAGVTEAFVLTPAALMTSLISEEAPKVVLAKALKLGIVKMSSIKLTAVPLIAKKAAVASILSAKAAVVATVAAVAIGGTALIATKEQPKPVPTPVVPVTQPVQQPVVPAPQPAEPVKLYRFSVIAPTRNSLWGYKDIDGNVVIEPKYQLVEDFSEGLAAVKIDYKWGFIDKNENLVIKPRFDFIKRFSDGMCAVCINRKWGYIKRKGELVIEARYDGDIRNFGDGMAPVKTENGKWKYIDKSGKTAIQKEFDGAWEFAEGLAPVAENGLWGYIDRSGNIVIKPRFSNAHSFEKGRAEVWIDGKMVKIDRNGAITPAQ